MALAYPEGECFFKRSALATSQADGYHADNLKDFYGHFILEYVWNQWGDHGSDCNPNLTNDRSKYKIVKGNNWGTQYGVWDRLPISYGQQKDIKRRYQHNLCTDGNRIRDREKGASAEASLRSLLATPGFTDDHQAWFMTLQMPTKSEEWVWIDMLTYIRGIYIPIAHQTDQQFESFSTFLQVNFTQRSQVKIWMPEKPVVQPVGYMGKPVWGRFDPYVCDKTFGLKYRSDTVVGINIRGLQRLLSLPRQLRKDNPYSAKYIVFIGQYSIPTVPLTGSFKDGYDFSWTTVAGANHGLELQWQPPTYTNFFVNYVKRLIEFGLGEIPLVGTILETSFSLGWTLVTDPDQFYTDLKYACPAIGLTDLVFKELKEEVEKVRKHLPVGWSKAGQAFTFAKPIRESSDIDTELQKATRAADKSDDPSWDSGDPVSAPDDPKRIPVEPGDNYNWRGANWQFLEAGRMLHGSGTTNPNPAIADTAKAAEQPKTTFDPFSLLGR